MGSKAVDTDFPFQYITQIKENIYLVADKGKLAQYNFRTKKLKFINIPCPHNRINTIAALGTDTLALGTDNGLILFSAHDNMFRQIDIRTSTQPSNYVEQIYQDRQKRPFGYFPAIRVLSVSTSTAMKKNTCSPLKMRLSNTDVTAVN